VRERGGEREREKEGQKVTVSIRRAACGLPHIRANCQFINIMPEKCIFERVYYGGGEGGA